jgi:hypothetical protein
MRYPSAALFGHIFGSERQTRTVGRFDNRLLDGIHVIPALIVKIFIESLQQY